MSTDESFPINIPHGDEPDTIRARIPRIRAITETCYMQLASDLWSVYHRKLYTDWGFDTFDDYVLTEVGISKDRSYRLRHIFAVLVMKCGLTPDSLKDLGRSKAEKLLPYVTRENAATMVREAKQLSFGKFVAKIEKIKAKQAASKGVIDTTSKPSDASLDPSARPAGVRLTSNTLPGFHARVFHLPKETDTLVDEALAEAKRITKSPSDGFNLGCIAQHFLAHRLTTDSADDGRLLWFMRGMERVYGGKLLRIKDDRAWDVLRAAVEASEHENLFDYAKDEEDEDEYGEEEVDE